MVTLLILTSLLGYPVGESVLLFVHGGFVLIAEVVVHDSVDQLSFPDEGGAEEADSVRCFVLLINPFAVVFVVFAAWVRFGA